MELKCTLLYHHIILLVMMGGKSVTVKTSDKKILVTVMLAALEDGRKLSPFIILNHTTVPKEQLPAEIIVRCQTKGQMTIGLMKDWWAVFL